MKSFAFLVVLGACDQGRYEPPPTPAAGSPDVARDERAAANETVPRKPTAAEYRAELAQLGARLATAFELGVPEGLTKEGEIPAYGPCQRPSAAQRNAVTKTLAAWVKTQIGEAPQEPIDPSLGCVTPAGIVANVHGDTKQIGNWWTVRVQNDRVEELAHQTGTPYESWMEWADEHTVSTDALVDLDHDGVLDLFVVDSQHEGGAMRSSYVMSAFLSSTQKLESIATFWGNLYAPAFVPKDGAFVIAMEREDLGTHRIFRCITEQAKMSSCAAALEARKADDKLVLAQQLASTDVALPTREELTTILTTLGVSVDERAEVLARYPS